MPSSLFNKYKGFVPVKSFARYNLFFFISKKENANILLRKNISSRQQSALPYSGKCLTFMVVD